MPATRADPVLAPAEIVDSGAMILRSVITTAQPDRAGDVVIPAGLRNAEAFMSNPVVLWAHQRMIPPIGTCIRLILENDRIIAETRFARSPLGREIFQLYAEGVLRGWSIGFLPRRTVPRRPGLRIEEWDLLEYSAVPVPENPEALTLVIRKALHESDILRLLFAA